MDFQAIDHKYQPVDWETEGAKFNEPRIGRYSSSILDNDSTSLLVSLILQYHLKLNKLKMLDASHS